MSTSNSDNVTHTCIQWVKIDVTLILWVGLENISLDQKFPLRIYK